MDSTTLIQSYVKRKWFVSTIRRRSSAMVGPPAPMYHETLVWEWNAETRKRGSIIWQGESPDGEMCGLGGHQTICGNLVAYGTVEAPENEEGAES